MSPHPSLQGPAEQSTAERVAAALAPLRPISLDEILATAELQTRFDGKYLVSLEAFDRLLEAWRDRLSVLEIDGSRLFRYESVYFDTPQLTTYRQHAHGRRRRVKIRTRAYLDSDECLLELKFVGTRGETVKERNPYSMEQRFDLSEPARALLAERLTSLVDVRDLRRTITTGYRRATMVDVSSCSRLTCDVNLRFANDDQERMGPPGVVLLESKAVAGARALETDLHRLGLRPLSLSKYCLGMAMLDPGLPANRWNRALRGHFGWTPAAATGAR
jgi:VTC domain